MHHNSGEVLPLDVCMVMGDVTFSELLHVIAAGNGG